MTELRERNGVKIDRYIDELQAILGAIPHDNRLDGQAKGWSMTSCWELEDKTKPLGKQTVANIVAISNSIRDSIQWRGIAEASTKTATSLFN